MASAKVEAAMVCLFVGFEVFVELGAPGKTRILRVLSGALLCFWLILDSPVVI